MANPNNCSTCGYSQLNGNREKGHCYMFRDEPIDICMQHTGRNEIENTLKMYVPKLQLANLMKAGK